MNTPIKYRFPAYITALILTLATAVLPSSCSPGNRLVKRQIIDPKAELSSPAFIKETTKALNSPWRDGNFIQTLVNGGVFYPAMLRDIRAAQKTITYETFAFIDGNTANEFIAALTERAQAGVKVHMILDKAGSKLLSNENIEKLRDGGVDLRFYHALKVHKPLEYNIRDHRKIIVIDGKVGFTGGSGVGDAWRGNARSNYEWRDTHFRIKGPLVADLQRGFNINWVKTGGPKLQGSDYFPPLKSAGNMKAQAFDSAPQDKIFPVPHLYRQAFASARKSIVIENSYIVMDKPMLDAVLDARARGVHVEIITSSEHCDSWPVRYASTFQYHKLLKAGVHIYEFQPSMMHCKIMVIDELFSTIGSANLDPRSLYINDESNVNVMNRSFAKSQLMLIEADKKRCKRILKAKNPWNPADWPMRSFLGAGKFML